MKSRRQFLKQSGFIGLFPALPWTQSWENSKSPYADQDDLRSSIEKAIKRPILKKELLHHPIIIKSVDLIKIEDQFIVRVRSTEGVEGYNVCNWGISNFYPIFIKHVGPFFEGKDARELEDLITACFLGGSHYKMQSMAIWTPIACAELAILDLLGKVNGNPCYELLGGISNPKVQIYWANNYRGESAEESVRKLVENYQKELPPAIKIKIAGRMGEPEEPAGRSEKMIPMIRKALGDQVTIYADANGGYDTNEAIRIGKILEENNFAFFEEPCPFYNLWETKKVADELSIPIAAGEQESSQRRFQWMVENQGADILQPDLYYYGGIIRSIRVARMAEVAGMEATPHVSGGGMNMLYIANFAAIVPNAGPHHEYKAPKPSIQYEMEGGFIVADKGEIKVPNSPGFGFTLDPDWINSGRNITKRDLI